MSEQNRKMSEQNVEMSEQNVKMNHPRQKIPEFESSPVKNYWGPMTPVKIWA